MTINEHIGSTDRHDYFVVLSDEIIKKAVSLNVGDMFNEAMYWHNDQGASFKRNDSRDNRCHYFNGDVLYVKEEVACCPDSFFTYPHYFVTDGELSGDVRHDAGLLKNYPASQMPMSANRIVLEIIDRDNGATDPLHRDIIYNIKFKVLKNKWEMDLNECTLKPKNNNSILEPVNDKFNFNEMFEKSRKTSAYKEQTMLCEFSDVIADAMDKRMVDSSQLAHKTNIPYDKIVYVLNEEKFFTLEELSKVAEALQCTFRLSVKYDKKEQ